MCTIYGGRVIHSLSHEGYGVPKVEGVQQLGIDKVALVKVKSNFDQGSVATMNSQLLWLQ